MSFTLPLFNLDPAEALTNFEQILLSNSGEDGFESAIKLLGAKLASEIDGDANSEPTFRIYDNPELTHKKIEALYRNSIKRWPELNGTGNSLGITPTHLVRALRPLVGWKLIGSDLSHLDAALERLVSKDSKGDLGQYFTPREVIRFCVQVMHPTGSDTILDPACGSAGFLFEASRQAFEEFRKAPICLGIDFGARASKVATLLSLAARDFSIKFTKANSLDGREYINTHPQSWSSFLEEEKPASKSALTPEWGAWSRLRCTLLFANPPFAGEIDDISVLSAYESLRGRKSQKSVSREQLFLERSVKLLRPGGRMAIVLPQGLLSNSSSAYLRQWLYSHVRILGIVGLHPHTFVPNTGVKTSILFLERKLDAGLETNDYNVFFGVSKNPGKDSSGRTSPGADYDHLAIAFQGFLMDESLSWAKRIKRSVRVESEFEVVRLREILETGRLDAEFYDPTARKLLKRMRNQADGTIRDYVDHASIEKFRARSHSDIGYVDISSVDTVTGLITPSFIPADEAPSRASYLVKAGDILVSTVRPERGTIGLITKVGEVPLVASNGFCVLRPTKVEPEVLFAFCKSPAFRTMLSRSATASMYPTVNEADVLNIPMPLPSESVRAQICDSIQKALRGIQASYLAMEAAIGSITDF